MLSRIHGGAWWWPLEHFHRIWGASRNLKCASSSYTLADWEDGVLRGYRRPICGVLKLWKIAWMEEREAPHVEVLAQAMEDSLEGKCGRWCAQECNRNFNMRRCNSNQKVHWEELTCDPLVRLHTPLADTSSIASWAWSPFLGICDKATFGLCL